MATKTPDSRAIEEAKRHPGGWVFEIVGNYGPNDAVPPHAIAGVWRVDNNGEIVGEFEPSPNFRDEERLRAERFAAQENDWVRARILKRDVPAEGSLREIAERARGKADRSLGRDHPAYAVATQNLGLYFDAIENQPATAETYFAGARDSLKGSDGPLAEGFSALGAFHLESSQKFKRAEANFERALAILRQGEPGAIDLARTLVGLSDVRARLGARSSAIALLEEAMIVRQSQAGPGDPDLEAIDLRLAILRGAAKRGGFGPAWRRLVGRWFHV